MRGACPTGQLSIEKINCNLKELTKFAKATNKHLVELDKFVLTFFQCTQYSQVTVYGDPLGSQGYVYDPGTGVTFKITALDETNDITTEPFLNFYVVKPTQKCIDFSNQA